MTPLRLFAIGLVVFGTTIAWTILGATVQSRTGESDYALRQQVAQLWGGQHRQLAPTVWYDEPREVTRVVQETDTLGRPIERTIVEIVNDRMPMPLERSRIAVSFQLAHRQKGLLWYDTYAVEYVATYQVSHRAPGARHVHVHFDFPAAEGIYDAFGFRVAGVDERAATDLSSGVTSDNLLDPGQPIPIEIRYRSRGLDDWAYSFGENVSQVRDFELVANTDFAAIDFPPGTMSPTSKVRQGRGWKLLWQFESLATGQKVGLDMPARLNPGPLASRISYFAPVSLLFFVTVMVILGVLRGRSLHPMNYFFLSAGFFAFHLLLAYLVDHLDLHLSFLIAAVVSVFLVVVYLLLAAGLRVAVLEAGLAQLVFLVLFSYAFFFEGYTGLTVTVGAIVTLFVLMLLTGRVDWSTVFARKPPPSPASPVPPAAAPAT